MKISDILSKTTKLKSYILKPLWQKTVYFNIKINFLSKEEEAIKHRTLFKNILSIVNSKNIIIYTNNSKIKDKIDANLIFMQKRNTEELFWNLKSIIKVYNEELLTIV